MHSGDFPLCWIILLVFWLSTRWEVEVGLACVYIYGGKKSVSLNVGLAPKTCTSRSTWGQRPQKEQQVHILHLICSLWQMPIEETITLNYQHYLNSYIWYFHLYFIFSPSSKYSKFNFQGKRVLQNNGIKMDICYVLYFSWEPYVISGIISILQIWKLRYITWLA